MPFHPRPGTKTQDTEDPAQIQERPLTLGQQILQDVEELESAAPDTTKTGEPEENRNPLFQFLLDVPVAVGRGAARAVKETAKTADSFVGWLAGTKVGKALLVDRRVDISGGEEGKGLGDTLIKFLDEGNTLFPGIGDFDLGPAPKTQAGAVVESISQFVVGLVGISKVLKPFKVVKEGISLPSFLNITLQGAVVDAVMFDPFEARLADMVADYGPEFSRGIGEFMQSEPGDNEAVARLKASLEGAVLGGTIDAFLVSLRGLWRIRRIRSGKVKGKAAEAEARAAMENFDEAAELAEAARTGKGADEIRIKDNDDGTFSALADGAEDGPKFNSRGDAEAAAASANDAAANARIPAGELTGDLKEQIINRAQELGKATSSKELRLLADGTIFNFNYAATTKQARATIQAMAEIMKPVFDEMSQRGVKTLKVTQDLADDLIENLDADQTVAAMHRVFGAVDNIREILLSTRMYQHSMADHVYKLARRADMNPNDMIAIDELTKALDILFDVSVDLDGTVSKLAGGLQQQQIPIVLTRGSKKQAKAGTRSAADKELDDFAEFVDEAERTVRRLQSADEAAQAGAVRKGDSKTTAGRERLEREASEGADEAVTHRRADEQAPASRRVTEGLTRPQIRTLARRVRLAQGDPNSIIAEVRALRKIAEAKASAGASIAAQGKVRGAVAKAIGYRMNSMLSGPTTHLTNIVSNMSVAFHRPAEIWWAGVASGNQALRREGSDLMMGNFLFLRDSWAAARKAMNEGINSLDPAFRTDEMVHSFAEGNWIQRLFKAPTRLLMSEDEFAKQLGYRTSVRAQSLRLAREDSEAMIKSGQLKPEDLGEFMGRRVSEDMKAAFSLDGETGRQFGVNQKALDYARVGTFTNPLDDGLGSGNFGKAAQDFAQEWPLTRLIVPFIRTPIQLFRYTHQRTPLLNRFNRQARHMYAAGGEQRALIVAQTQMGGAVYVTAAMLVASKTLTGGGPEDPDLREAWLANNEPYSIKIPGVGWVSYRRLDPIATPLGLVADFAEGFGELQEAVGQNIVEDTAIAILASIAEGLANKTFFRSVTEFMQASTSGNASMMKRFIRNFTATFVPFGVAQQQIAKGIDPVFREVRTFMDNLRSRTPGFSKTLEPQRNIFGEKILRPPGFFNRAFNPMQVMNKERDEIMQMFIDMGRGFSMPRTHLENGRIDLTNRTIFDNGTGQSPYDRWMELLSIKGGRMPALTVREAVVSFSDSPGWDELPAGSELEPGGFRWRIVNDIIQGYRAFAMIIVRDEYPKLNRMMARERAVSSVSNFGDEAVERMRAQFDHNSATPQEGDNAVRIPDFLNRIFNQQ